MALFEDFFGTIDKEIIKLFNEYLNFGFNYRGKDRENYELYFKYSSDPYVEIKQKERKIRQRKNN